MPILKSLLNSLLGLDKPEANAPPQIQQQQQTQTQPPSQTQPQSQRRKPAPPPLREHTPLLSRRSFRQFGLFLGGCGFVSLSVLLSRRAIRRHTLRSQLKYFQSNIYSLIPPKDGSPAIENAKDPMVAFEALNLATVNVFSFAIMVAGGLSWSLDISTLDDLKHMAQRTLHRQVGNIDEESEQEVTEWFAKTLGMGVPDQAQDQDTAAADGGKVSKKP